MSQDPVNRRAALFALLSTGAALAVKTARAEVHAQGAGLSVELRGATAMLPLAQRVAEAFMAENADSTVAVSSGGAARGLKAIIVGTAEIAMATNVLPEQLDALARARKVTLKRFDVFRDGVVPVVNPKNPLSDLAVWTLRDIFRGAVKNWKEVGGPDLPIVVLSYAGRSGTYETFKQAVLGDSAVVTPSAITADAAHIIKKVSADPGAIGYLALHDAAQVKDSLKALTINGIAGTTENVKNQTYRILRTSSLWAKEPISPATKQVIDQFLSPTKGQAFVADLGDVPVL